MRNPIEGLLHPRFDRIEAFASGQATERDRAAVSQHLQSCARCLERVREIRALRVAARDEEVPGISSGLRERIVERARSGERRIIPVGADPVTASSSMRRRIIAAGLIAAGVAAVVLVPRGGLEAGPTAGVLTLAQKASLPTPMLSVRYVPPSTFASADSVTLRAATYVAKRPGPSIDREYWLKRGGDGAFTADVTLPIGTVFAQYSVVSPDGKHTDDNDARGWELPVTDASATPLFEGLWLQRVLNGRANWERASAAGKAMVKYYPENPASLRNAISDEAQLVGPSRSDSVRALHRPRVVALHEKYIAASMDPTTMWEWAMVLDEVNDTMRTRQWRERMIREHPRDAGTIQQRVFALGARKLSREQRMIAMEKIWDESGGQSVQLLADGFELAAKLQDSAAVARWGDRMMKFGGPYQTMVPAQYVTVPAFRARGEAMLRDLLRAMPPIQRADWRAALLDTELNGMRRGQWQLNALGKALLEDGAVGSARDTLRRAAALGWDARTLRALGDAELAAEDTVEAMHAYAWAVADSRTSAARADSLRARLGAAGRDDAWPTAVAGGRDLIGALTLRTAVRRPFDASATYVDANGTRRSFRETIGKTLSVVAFVSRYCAPSLSDVAALDSVTAALAKRGITVLTLVGDEAPNAEAVATFAKHGFKGALAFDDRTEVSRRMRQSGTPHYFVAEEGKVVRYDARRAEDLLMLVETLQRKSR